jgi:Flp pilus assembly protein TadD
LALGHALFTAGRYAEAVQAIEIAVTRDSAAKVPRWSAIYAYGQLGREKDAQTHLEAFAKIVGAPVQALTVQGMTADPVPPYKDPADLERVREGFRKAGLPEE